MKTFTDLDAAKILTQAAVSAGAGYAQMLKVGDKFLGVHPAACLAFPQNEYQRQLYVSAALAKLPKRIVSNDEGIITELG